MTTHSSGPRQGKQQFFYCASGSLKFTLLCSPKHLSLPKGGKVKDRKKLGSWLILQNPPKNMFMECPAILFSRRSLARQPGCRKPRNATLKQEDLASIHRGLAKAEAAVRP